jgi:hypothetical protein
MPTMNVRVKSIWLCPKRSLDYALGRHEGTEMFLGRRERYRRLSALAITLVTGPQAVFGGRYVPSASLYGNKVRTGYQMATTLELTQPKRMQTSAPRGRLSLDSGGSQEGQAPCRPRSLGKQFPTPFLLRLAYHNEGMFLRLSQSRDFFHRI